MAQLTIGPVHHIRLSVNDLDRSRAFSTELLGFQVAMDSLPPEDDPHYEALAYNLQGGIVLMNAGLPFRNPDGIQLELTAPL